MSSVFRQSIDQNEECMFAGETRVDESVKYPRDIVHIGEAMMPMPKPPKTPSCLPCQSPSSHRRLSAAPPQ